MDGVIQSTISVQDVNMIAFPQFLKVTIFLWCLDFQNVVSEGGDLLTASRNGKAAMVRKILSSMNPEPNVFFRDHTHKRTALHWASFEGHLDVVELLLHYNSDDDHLLHMASDRMTALMYASLNGHVQVVARLLQCQSAQEQLLLQNEDGQTALMLAVINTRVDVVSVMMDFVKPEHLQPVDKYHQSTLDHAYRSGDESIIDLVRDLHSEECGEFSSPSSSSSYA